MKKLSYFFSIAAAVLFVGCNNESLTPETTEDGDVMVFVSAKPEFDDNTKTAWDGSKVDWSVGDQIRVACYNYTTESWRDQSGDSNSPKAYKSNALTAQDIIDGVAHFSFSGGSQFNVQNGSFRFFAVSPVKTDEAFANKSDFSKAPVLNGTLKTSQPINATGFDASTDIMVGASTEKYTSNPYESDIELRWKRLVAFPVITFNSLKDAEDGEIVNRVKLTVQEGTAISGTVSVNLFDASIDASTDNGGVNYVEASSPSGVAIDANHSFVTWFTTIPFKATSIKVEISTNKADYARIIDLSSNNKTFVANKRNLLTINMNTSDTRREVKGNGGNQDGPSIIFTAGTDKTSNTSSTENESLTKDGITMKSSKGAYGNDDGYRFYANASTTFTSTIGNITKIELVQCNTSYPVSRFTLPNSSAGTVSTVTENNITTRVWDCDGAEVTSVELSHSSQARASVVRVFYETPKTLTGIEVKEVPSTTIYHVGDYFNPAGLVITASYDDNSTEDIAYAGNESKFTFEPSLTTAFTSEDVQVSIAYGGQNCSQSIEVRTWTLQSISVKTNPTKMSYYVDDSFDPAGLVLNAIYNDGYTDDEREVSDGYTYTETTFDAVTTSELKASVEISYKGKTCFVEGIEVSTRPTDLVTIQWSVNGNTAVVSPSVVTVGEDITFPTASDIESSIPSGYEFKGWIEESSYSNATTAPTFVSSATASENKTYYAVFAQLSTTKTPKTFYFEPFKGSAISSGFTSSNVAATQDMFVDKEATVWSHYTDTKAAATTSYATNLDGSDMSNGIKISMQKNNSTTTMFEVKGIDIQEGTDLNVSLYNRRTHTSATLLVEYAIDGSSTYTAVGGTIAYNSTNDKWKFSDGLTISGSGTSIDLRISLKVTGTTNRVMLLDDIKIYGNTANSSYTNYRTNVD